MKSVLTKSADYFCIFLLVHLISWAVFNTPPVWGDPEADRLSVLVLVHISAAFYLGARLISLIDFLGNP